MRKKTTRVLVAAVAASLFLTACSGASEDSASSESVLSGSIEIDGSSTVGPLTDAIAEEYADVQPDVTVNLSISGTGGGFERFCETGDTQFSNASPSPTNEQTPKPSPNPINQPESTFSAEQPIAPSSNPSPPTLVDNVVKLIFGGNIKNLDF